MALAATIKHVFTKYPRTANTVVYGTLYTGAEFSQQTLNKKIRAKPKQDYDLKALGRFAIFGTTIGTNVLYTWYRWLDRVYVGTAPKTIITKMALDQCTVTPALIASFYIFMSIMERKENIFEECRAKLLPTYLTSCVFWLPAQAMNFWLIPPQARVVYVGACAFLWLNIVSWFKSQPFEHAKD